MVAVNKPPITTVASGIQANELKREIRMFYLQLIDIRERELVLQSLDTVYSRFGKAAALRLETGESNQLEKTTADAMLEQLQSLVQKEPIVVEYGIETAIFYSQCGFR